MVDQFMIQVLKKVNMIYPSELGLEKLNSKKEVIDILLSEINIGKEEEKRVIDKNDLEYITINEDLTVQVGVRTFIVDENQDYGNWLIEYRPKD